MRSKLSPEGQRNSSSARKVVEPIKTIRPEYALLLCNYFVGSRIRHHEAELVYIVRDFRLASEQQSDERIQNDG